MNCNREKVCLFQSGALRCMMSCDPAISRRINPPGCSVLHCSPRTALTRDCSRNREKLWNIRGIFNAPLAFQKLYFVVLIYYNMYYIYILHRTFLILPLPADLMSELHKKLGSNDLSVFTLSFHLFFSFVDGDLVSKFVAKSLKLFFMQKM